MRTGDVREDAHVSGGAILPTAVAMLHRGGVVLRAPAGRPPSVPARNTRMSWQPGAPMLSLNSVFTAAHEQGATWCDDCQIPTTPSPIARAGIRPSYEPRPCTPAAEPFLLCEAKLCCMHARSVDQASPVIVHTAVPKCCAGSMVGRPRQADSVTRAWRSRRAADGAAGQGCALSHRRL